MFGQLFGQTEAPMMISTLAPAVPELKDFDWAKSAPRSTLHKGSIQPIAAGGDGRPAGYREWQEAR